MCTARLLRAAAAVVFLCAAVGAPAAGARAQADRTSSARSVYLDGDSLAVGDGLFLAGLLPGWSVEQSTDVSRHVRDGLASITSRDDSLPRVIVVDLGTNDDPGATDWFRRSVEQIVRAAGPHRCVIWSNIVRPPYNGVPYDAYNDILRRVDRRYRNFRVLDWVAMARANPQWFGPDGVHPTATGYRARAAALARLIKRC